MLWFKFLYILFQHRCFLILHYMNMTFLNKYMQSSSTWTSDKAGVRWKTPFWLCFWGLRLRGSEQPTTPCSLIVSLCSLQLIALKLVYTFEVIDYKFEVINFAIVTKSTLNLPLFVLVTQKDTKNLDYVIRDPPFPIVHVVYWCTGGSLVRISVDSIH